MQLSEGASLGPYRILGRVGAGGMGEVYRANDTRLDRDVAIKVLPEGFSKDQAAIKRFRREAKALASLSHPNILTVYDIGEQDGVIFVVMELLQGETLRSRMRRYPPSCDQAIEIITAVTQGLVAAHAQGIIHRDLKPENIFITKDEHIKILDFGLAKQFYPDGIQDRANLPTLTQETGFGVILGTVPYMSPEQARGDQVDQKTDIFSTGTILYELLTGKLPFSGPSAAVILHKIIYEDCSVPSTLKPELPKRLDPIVQRALAKEKEKRYSSASELLNELKHYGAGSMTTTQKVDIRSPRRIISPQIAVTAGLIALLLIPLAFWFFKRQAKIRWARQQALPQIERLLLNSWRDSTEAYALAEEAEKYIPDDPTLANLFAKISLKINVKTEPSGARVYAKDYKSPEAEWTFVGVSPIDQLRVPIGIRRWKIEKEGYETVLAAATTFNIDISRENLVVPYDLSRVLDEVRSEPKGMVRVAGAKTSIGPLEDFYIDRYEVTNLEYKKFLDSDGYRKKEYWKHAFIEGGKSLSWEEAMARFVDQTGRAGPAGWQAGDYPAGQSNYPVGGISWYEAAAYAEFVGKQLPTETHWHLATGGATPLILFPQLGGFAVFAPFSNFQGNGPVEVGSLSGITAYGAFDMAGNLREWCWNETAKGRLLRGGAWGENTYSFSDLSHAPSMDRSVKNGIRCALYPDHQKIPDTAFAAVQLPEVKDHYGERPVEDAVFQVYKDNFSYDKVPLNARVESRTQNPEGWVHEKISFDAPYAGERIIAHLFLPSTAPPYQTVIYYPGSASYLKESSDDIEAYYEFPLFLSFIVKNGRAVLYPVYNGTFERRKNGSTATGNSSYQFAQFLIQEVQDFRRCIDYVETRADLDSSKIAYYGMSAGGWRGGIIPAVEDRVQASVLVAGGFNRKELRPEIAQINYIPRIRIPTLMLNGKYDTIHPYESSIKPMFDLLGTPKDKKELRLYETDHIPPRNELVKETLAWLDRYLGPTR